MNRKWTVLIIAAFIVTNVVTFLFAQNRLAIMAKAPIATDYSDKSEPGLDKPQKFDEKNSSAIKAGGKSSGYRNFDDSGRYIVNSEDSAPDANIKQNVDTGKNDSVAGTVSGQAKEAPDQEASIAAPYSYANNYAGPVLEQPYYNTPPKESNPANDLELPPKDEIPVPQLPGLGEEYETPDDDSGPAGIQLPQLPDT